MDRIRLTAVGVCALALACVSARLNNASHNTSIAFPSFSSPNAVRLDATTVRALQVATEDFFPWYRQLRPGLSDLERCIYSPRSLDYTIIRGEAVTFVRLQVNPKRCGGHGAVADSGANYAIDIDGRILRRLLDGEPDLGVEQCLVVGQSCTTNAECCSDLCVTTDGGLARCRSSSSDGGIEGATSIDTPSTRDGGIWPPRDDAGR